jgi:hypothetical protein
MKKIGKSRSVSIFTNIQIRDNKYEIICEFDETGTITIYPNDEFENCWRN